MDIAALVISIIGTITALCAVFVTIWQATLPYHRKIKVAVLEHARSAQDSKSNKYFKKTFFGVRFTNVCYTDIDLIGWGLFVDKKHFDILGYFKYGENSLAKHRIIRKSFPAYGIVPLVESYLTKRNKNKRVKIFIQDTDGDFYYGKTQYRVKDIVFNKNLFSQKEISEDEYIENQSLPYELGFFKDAMADE